MTRGYHYPPKGDPPWAETTSEKSMRIKTSLSGRSNFIVVHETYIPRGVFKLLLVLNVCFIVDVLYTRK